MIYFVRHGQSQANLDRVYAGQRLDSPLTVLGIEQAHEAAQDIKHKRLHFERVISSPLHRAQKTATIIAIDTGFATDQIETDPRLAEYDMGSLTGTRMNKTSVELIAPASAEDIHKFQRRVMAAIQEYAKLPGNTLIVAHAGVGKVIEATQSHHPLHIFHDLDGYPHGEVTALKSLNEQ